MPEDAGHRLAGPGVPEAHTARGNWHSQPGPIGSERRLRGRQVTPGLRKLMPAFATVGIEKHHRIRQADRQQVAIGTEPDAAGRDSRRELSHERPTLAAVELRDIGLYQCVVSNAAGSASSEVAELRLVPTLLIPVGQPFTPDGAFQFTLLVEAGKRFRVQYSTDLKDWSDLTTFDSTGAPFTVTDPGAAQRPGGFYRAVSP